MDKKQFAKLAKVTATVAAAGAVIVDPHTSPAQKRAAVAKVDALGSKGASHAVRGFGATIDQSAPHTPEHAAMDRLAEATEEERAQEARLLKMRSFIRGE